MISTGAKRVTSDTGARSRSQSYGRSLPTDRAHHARHGMIEQGVAVGRRARDRVHAEHASGAALIFDHHLLAEHVGQLLRGGARGEVDAAAGRQAAR